MYKKTSNNLFYNRNKNHYFYESVFSANGIEKIKGLIIENDFEVIEFLEANDSTAIWVESIFLCVNLWLFLFNFKGIILGFLNWTETS